MPKIYLKCTRRYTGKCRYEDPPSRQRRRFKRRKRIVPDLSACDDWSSVSSISIVTRWAIYKVPQVGPGEFSKPCKKLPMVRSPKCPRSTEWWCEAVLPRRSRRETADPPQQTVSQSDSFRGQETTPQDETESSDEK